MIGWNGETMPGLPLEGELDVVAQAGYGGLELFVPKLVAYLQQHTTAELGKALRERGLMPLAMNGIENINLRPEEEMEKRRQECRWLSQVSQEIGCPTIVVVPSPYPKGMGWSAIRSNTVASLRSLADVAAPYGVWLAFEFLAPVECSVRTLARASEIVRATERGNVGLVFDTYHFHVGGSSWDSLAQVDTAQLLIVHINDVQDLPLTDLTDGHRLLPGEGVLPLSKILPVLRSRGYDGAYSLEVMRPAYREREPLEYARAGFQATQRALGAG